MSAVPQNSVLGRISSLMKEINGVKTASAKQATEMDLSGSAKQDPGGYRGSSSHPSARTASNLQRAPLGSRAHENEADVEEDHPAAGVDNVDAGSGGDQDDKQINVGTKQRATGEDPAVEDAYKGDKDDRREGDRGGTSHPANAEDVGEKYSSMRLPDLTKLAFAKMNDVLADIANGVFGDVKTAADYQAQATGYQLAEAAGAPNDMQKAAAQAVIEQTILDARFNGDLVGEFLTKYAGNCDMLLKQADPGPMGGAMEGEANAPPGLALGEPEGPPPGSPEGPPGEGGGGPEAGIDEFINALLAMGITPEEIEAHLQQHMAGGGGPGGPPEGAGGPPTDAVGGGAPLMGADMGKMGADQQTLYKVASIAKQRFRSGQWRPQPVYAGTKEAEERTELQRYIMEVCRAS